MINKKKRYYSEKCNNAVMAQYYMKTFSHRKLATKNS